MAIEEYWYKGDEHTNTTPQRGNPCRKRLPGAKILGDNSDSRQKKASKPRSREDTLRDQELPVHRAYTSQAQSQHSKHPPHHQERAQVSSIIKRPNQCPDEKQQEGLNGADPGDGGGGDGGESGRVVGLIDAVHVDDAPADC